MGHVQHWGVALLEVVMLKMAVKIKRDKVQQ